MLADGTVSMVVIAKTADEVRCQVIGGGIIRSRQGINLPGAKLSVASLTEADMTNAIWAAKNDIDFVSLSFVRKAVDVLLLKELLQVAGLAGDGRSPRSKSRRRSQQLPEIVAAADGVMVARGDLGVEIDVAEIAVVQKRIVAECQRQGKPVIVATQMLDSMHHNRRPTRAEATDVANAILDGADACMLSGETAIGEFPVEAVETMNRIMLATEPLLKERGRSREPCRRPTCIRSRPRPCSGSAMIAEQARGEAGRRRHARRRHLPPAEQAARFRSDDRRQRFADRAPPADALLGRHAAGRRTGSRRPAAARLHRRVGPRARPASQRATASSSSPARISIRWRRTFW